MVWLWNVPQRPYVEGLVDSLWCLLESGRTFRRWGLMEGSWVTETVPLKEISGTLAFFSLSQIPSCCDRILLHHTLHTLMLFIATGPKQWASWPWTKASEILSQDKSCPLEVECVRYFSHSSRIELWLTRSPLFIPLTFRIMIIFVLQWMK
jgi:hypothetical protein